MSPETTDRIRKLTTDRSLEQYNTSADIVKSIAIEAGKHVWHYADDPEESDVKDWID